MQQWQDTVGGLLAAQQAGKAGLDYPLILAEVEPRRQSERDPKKTADERQLAWFCAEFALGLRELTLSGLTPDDRILTLEEFWRLNADALEKMMMLQERISAGQSEKRVVEVAERRAVAVPGSVEAERRTLRARLLADREAIEQLPPEKRAAALEREDDFFRERVERLQQLDKQPIASQPTPQP